MDLNRSHEGQNRTANNTANAKLIIINRRLLCSDSPGSHIISQWRKTSQPHPNPALIHHTNFILLLYVDFTIRFPPSGMCAEPNTAFHLHQESSYTDPDHGQKITHQSQDYQVTSRGSISYYTHDGDWQIMQDGTRTYIKHKYTHARCTVLLELHIYWTIFTFLHLNLL